ncbi:MAG: PHP-associated domain-containing protein [Dehalococcoidia bacterium]|nr:PHP-associated domain-containing protein [Dehalococcoidia bacterium]
MEGDAALNETAGTGRADLQVHTRFGDGMATAREIFDWNAEYGGLDVIAVTDHDDVRGALEAREAWAQGGYSFDFVPGIEVTTRSGHLLALWVDTPIPSLRGLDETVELIHEAGGLAVVPHAFSMGTRSVGRRALERVMRLTSWAQKPDGLEVANPVRFGWDCGEKTHYLNRTRWGLAETGGSDAHFMESLGSAYTEFPGRTAEELRSAIVNRQTRGVLSHGTPLREIGLRKLVHQQVRGLSVTPRKVLGQLFGRG